MIKRCLLISLVFSVILVFYWKTSFGLTPFYEPALQAQAFLEGHAWVDNAPGYMESEAKYNGHGILLHPPLAGIVLMPLAQWFKKQGIGQAEVYQPRVCEVLGALAAALVFRLCLTLNLTVLSSLWLTIFFTVGTTFWYESTLGASWDFVLVVCTIPTLLALNECYGKKRALLIGFFAGMAVLGRYDLALALPFYIWKINEK